MALQTSIIFKGFAVDQAYNMIDYYRVRKSNEGYSAKVHITTFKDSTKEDILTHKEYQLDFDSIGNIGLSDIYIMLANNVDFEDAVDLL